MFGLRPEDLVIILIVALLIFGPKQLPELGRSLGRTLNEFRSATKEVTQAVQEEAKKPEEAEKQEKVA